VLGLIRSSFDSVRTEGKASPGRISPEMIARLAA
jgi:hypothetical protein